LPWIRPSVPTRTALLALVPTSWAMMYWSIFLC
jgi:hypothetical protein